MKSALDDPGFKKAFVEAAKEFAEMLDAGAISSIISTKRPDISSSEISLGYLELMETIIICRKELSRIPASDLNKPRAIGLTKTIKNYEIKVKEIEDSLS